MNTYRASLSVSTGLAIVLALAACGTTPKAPMIPDDGPSASPLVAARPYEVTLPDSDARPAPLVLVLHGLSATGAGAVTGLSALGSLVGGIVAGTFTDRLVRRDPRWQMGVPIVGVGIALPAGLAYLAIAPGAVAPA